MPWRRTPPNPPFDIPHWEIRWRAGACSVLDNAVPFNYIQPSCNYILAGVRLEMVRPPVQGRLSGLCDFSLAVFAAVIC
jgi:hypothetical protein